MSYICPVCGYNQLRYPPEDYTICPSCGTEFGYHDFSKSHEELRNLWFANGAYWHSSIISKPKNWNPYLQLLNLQNEVKFNSKYLTDESVIVVEHIGNLEKTEGNVRIRGSWNLIQSPLSSVHI